jgi:hypothetical protein
MAKEGFFLFIYKQVATTWLKGIFVLYFYKQVTATRLHFF